MEELTPDAALQSGGGMARVPLSPGPPVLALGPLRPATSFCTLPAPFTASTPRLRIDASPTCLLPQADVTALDTGLDAMERELPAHRPDTLLGEVIDTNKLPLRELAAGLVQPLLERPPAAPPHPPATLDREPRERNKSPAR
jgi:hypothetical protein